MTAAHAETAVEPVAAFAAELRKWWTVGLYAEREDFIEKKLPELLRKYCHDMQMEPWRNV